jgi:hypothetical protein
VLLFPLSTTYRVLSSKVLSSDFWSDIIKNTNYTALFLKNIPSQKRIEIEKKPGFIRHTAKIKDFLDEELLDKKLKPFLKQFLKYLRKERATAPPSVLLKREKSKLYYLLTEYFSASVKAVPPRYRAFAESAIRNRFIRYFPDYLNAGDFLIPDAKRHLEKVRSRLSFYRKIHTKIILFPLAIALLIALLAFSPKRIFAWLGLSLIISIIIFASYGVVLFFGLEAQNYLYDQLRATTGLKAFFNPYLMPKAEFKTLLQKLILRPLAIEAILYFILGIVFVVISFKLKKKSPPASGAVMTEIG